MTDVKKNVLEWSVFAVSLMLVFSVLGYLLYTGLTDDDLPPVIDVQLGTAEQRGERYALPVTVENHGDQVAENLTIEVELTLPSGEQETSSIEIDFLPRDGQSDGWVEFNADPNSADEVTIRVPGYILP